MSCPTELEWSMYADGAATADEAVRLEAHLTSCSACAARVEVLRVESRALRAALQEQDERVPIPAIRGSRPFRASKPFHGPLAAAAVLIGLASTSFVIADVLGGLRLPGSIAWLNPFTPARLIEVVLGVLVLIATEGRSMLMSTIELAGAAVCVAVLAAAALAAARRSGGAAMLCVLLAGIVLSSQSHALEIMRSETVLSVPAGETVDDTLIALGDSIEIDGTVTGDLIAFGRQVVIRGTVEGQLITGARTVTLEGNLGGSVLGFAETLTFRNGEIARNLFGFGRQVTTNGDARIGGNAVVFASNAALSAPVETDVIGFAGEVDVSAEIGGDLTAHAGTLRVLGPARIAGDVLAHVENESDVLVSSGATVAGTVRTEIREERAGREEPGAARRFGSLLAGQAVRLGAAFVAGLILLWLVPPLQRMSLDGAGETVTAAGVGLVTLVAVPIIALMTAITLIGLPVAVLGVIVWLVGIYFAKIVLAHFVGKALLERAGHRKHFALALLVGLVIVMIAINLPLLGALLNFLLTITGLGMLVIFVWGLFQGRAFAE